MKRVTLIVTLAGAFVFALNGCKPESGATPQDESAKQPAPTPPPVQTPTPATQQPSQPPTQPPPDDSKANAPTSTDSTPYDGPPVTVQIVQAKRLPPISTAVIEITTPSGGWDLNLDKAEVVGDTAKIYLTLERPGEGEMVTHSLVTHKEEFTSEKPPFTKAEIYVHLAQRGIHTFTTNYRLAATK